MKTRLTELLNIKYPIICGAMARVSTPKLVSAVSNAGGLGVLATGSTDPDIVRQQIREIRRLTNKPFAVNIVIMNPNADDIAKLVCEENVEIVMTGAGSPSKYIDTFKNCGIKIIPVIPNVKVAKKMQDMGVDAVVAEGMESGGHVGETTTMSLLPQVRDAISIPLVAAGGIGDGRGMAAAFVLGADGVQLGSRFLLADECEIHNNFKQAVIDADDMATVITGKAVRHPVRVLKNDMTDELIKLEMARVSREEFNKVATGSLMLAVRDGDVKNGSMMCGQIAGLLTKIQPAKDIILEVCNEAEAILGKLNL